MAVVTRHVANATWTSGAVRYGELEKVIDRDWVGFDSSHVEMLHEMSARYDDDGKSGWMKRGHGSDGIKILTDPRRSQVRDGR